MAWLTLILEGKKPKDWEAFKQLFYVQFLPTNFEQDVKERDRLAQREHETVQRYVACFWSVLLKVTPSKRLTMKKRNANLKPASMTTFKRP